jgi:hypothetical protein
MIKHGIDGFVCHDKTIGALVDALNYYLVDPSIAVRQGVAAKLSLDRLGVPQFARRWLAVYERTT